MQLLLLLLQVLSLLSVSLAFQSTVSSSSRSNPLYALSVEQVIKDNYPSFHKLVSKNEKIFETLDELGNEYTFFAPNEKAFESSLTDKQRQQLQDPRNLETVQKMGLYHIINSQALSITDLNREDWTVPKTPEGLPALKIGALVTMGGEVPIGRFKKKRDSSLLRSLFPKTVRDASGKPVTEIVVGPEGTIIRSVKVGKCMIHETDGFCAPLLLWRYLDQLRMPGL